jgi:hypothetical protein
MDMETTDDDLLKQFMSEQKQEVPDDGFSNRVMHRLPRCERRAVRIWNSIFIVLGIFLFLIFNGFQAIAGLLRNLYISIMQSGSVQVNWKTVLILFCLISITGIYKAWEESDL